MYDRDFKTAIVRSRTAIGRSTVSLSYLWKGFGANNFYGGNAPSREWTNQTLLAAEHGLGTGAGWTWRLGESYRTHGDHFIFNQTNPALSNNQHRSHAVLATVAGSRRGVGRQRHRRPRGGRRLDPLDQPGQSLDRAGERVRRVAPSPGQDRAARRDAARGPLQRVRRVVEPVARRRLVAGTAAAAAGVGGARLPRADVHRALLLGPGQPGARRRRSGARVGRRGRRRRVRGRATGRCTRRSSAVPTATSSTGCARPRRCGGRPTTCAT